MIVVFVTYEFERRPAEFLADSLLPDERYESLSSERAEVETESTAGRFGEGSVARDDRQESQDPAFDEQALLLEINDTIRGYVTGLKSLSAAQKSKVQRRLLRRVGTVVDSYARGLGGIMEKLDKRASENQEILDKIDHKVGNHGRTPLVRAVSKLIKENNRVLEEAATNAGTMAVIVEKGRQMEAELEDLQAEHRSSEARWNALHERGQQIVERTKSPTGEQETDNAEED